MSRQVGYEWVKLSRCRVRRCGSERASRRPRTSPAKVSDDVEDWLVAHAKRGRLGGRRNFARGSLTNIPSSPSSRRKAQSVKCCGGAASLCGDVSGACAQPKHRRGPSRTSPAPTQRGASTSKDTSARRSRLLRAHDHRCALAFLIRCEGRRRSHGRECSGSSIRRAATSVCLRRFAPTTGRRLLPSVLAASRRCRLWWLRLGICVERIERGKPHISPLGTKAVGARYLISYASMALSMKSGTRMRLRFVSRPMSAGAFTFGIATVNVPPGLPL